MVYSLALFLLMLCAYVFSSFFDSCLIRFGDCLFWVETMGQVVLKLLGS